MAILNRDDLVPDDIQREKRMREFRQRAWEVLREEIAEWEREHCIKVKPELIEYFNSLDELFSTAEMVAGNDDYLVIHVDRKAFDEVRYFEKQYDQAGRL